MTPLVRVLIVEDHRVLLESLRDMIDDYPDLTVVGTAGTVDEAVRAAESCPPDVVLMDYRIPGGGGTAATAAIVDQRPETAVVFLSADYSEGAILGAIEAGAAAYLAKTGTMDAVVEVVRRAAAGDVPVGPELLARLLTHRAQHRSAAGGGESPDAELDARELSLLRALGEGLDNRQAAERLGLTEPAVGELSHTMLRKLGCRTRLAALLQAHERGLLGPAPTQAPGT